MDTRTRRCVGVEALLRWVIQSSEPKPGGHSSARRHASARRIDLFPTTRGE
ncbi:hypothetical protein PQR57_29690 [Paraburkholderia dipogonis]|uniref:Uncharacterized protein n=1 Tax=Paraburkholderia dipogonis TaxID=1211383 RepID=A0ABW9AZ50_9BURK